MENCSLMTATSVTRFSEKRIINFNTFFLNFRYFAIIRFMIANDSYQPQEVIDLLKVHKYVHIRVY